MSTPTLWLVELLVVATTAALIASLLYARMSEGDRYCIRCDLIDRLGRYGHLITVVALIACYQEKIWKLVTSSKGRDVLTVGGKMLAAWMALVVTCILLSVLHRMASAKFPRLANPGIWFKRKTKERVPFATFLSYLEYEGRDLAEASVLDLLDEYIRKYNARVRLTLDEAADLTDSRTKLAILEEYLEGGAFLCDEDGLRNYILSLRLIVMSGESRDETERKMDDLRAKGLYRDKPS